MASGADRVLDGARVFATLDEAVADLRGVYATTARHRDMIQREITPRHLAVTVRQRAAVGERCGILFGRERIGLTNEEVAHCDAVVVAPLNPEFTSLNLAQAVLLVAWEWRMAGDQTPDVVLVETDSRRATRRELDIFFARLETGLDDSGFFRVPHMRAITWRKIRNFLARAELTDQDVRILHGMVSAFEGKRLRIAEGRRRDAEAAEAAVAVASDTADTTDTTDTTDTED
jgi:tRNA/rRNA methyltransferase